MTLEGYEGERVLLSYDVSATARSAASRVCHLVFGRVRSSEASAGRTYQEAGFIHRPGVVWIGQSVLVMPPRDAEDLATRLRRLGVTVRTSRVEISRAGLESFRRRSRLPA